MNINLLPKEPFVVKYFNKLLVLVLLSLLFIAVLLMQYVLHQEAYLKTMQDDIAQLEIKKSQLEENKKWNQEVMEREQELKSFLKYKALIEGIEASRGSSWRNLLMDLELALPEYGQVLELNGEGNQVKGKAVLYSLVDTAYFLDRLENSSNVGKVFLQVLNDPAVYEQYYFDPQKVKIIEFTFYNKDLNEMREEPSGTS